MATLNDTIASSNLEALDSSDLCLNFDPLAEDGLLAFYRQRNQLAKQTTIANFRVVSRSQPSPLTTTHSTTDSEFAALYPKQQLAHCTAEMQLYMLVPCASASVLNRVRVSDDCKLVDLVDAIELCYRSKKNREIDLVPYLLGSVPSRIGDSTQHDLYTTAGLAQTVNAAGCGFPLFIGSGTRRRSGNIEVILGRYLKFKNRFFAQYRLCYNYL